MSLASQFLDTLNAIGNDIKSLVSQTTKADKTEAEGLTDNTKLMTPLRVKEAVDAIIRTGKIVHTGNTPPVDPIDNMLWYDTNEGYLAVFLNNGITSQWVTILGGAGSSTTAWADITDKPASFPPDIHQHDWSSIQNKPSGYVPISHSHSVSEVDGLLAAFNNKISSTEKGEASGVAPLDESSKIPAIYLPASDVANNDLLLHGPIIVIQKLLEGSAAFNTWINATGNISVFRQLLNSYAGLTYLVNNSTAMTSLANSALAMGDVVTNISAMGVITSSKIAIEIMVSIAPSRTAIVGSSTAVTSIANSLVAMRAVMAHQVTLNALSASSNWSLFKASTVFPVMSGSLLLTADSIPGFVTVAASSIYGAGFDAFRAFDNVSTTRWAAAASAASGAWVSMIFTQPRFIHTIRLTPNAANVYTAWRLEYSNNAGASWLTALSVPSYNAQTGVTTDHAVALAERYKHWRFFVTTSTTGFAATREIELQGWY